MRGAREWKSPEEYVLVGLEVQIMSALLDRLPLYVIEAIRINILIVVVMGTQVFVVLLVMQSCNICLHRQANLPTAFKIQS